MKCIQENITSVSLYTIVKVTAVWIRSLNLFHLNITCHVFGKTVYKSPLFIVIINIILFLFFTSELVIFYIDCNVNHLKRKGLSPRNCDRVPGHGWLRSRTGWCPPPRLGWNPKIRSWRFLLQHKIFKKNLISLPQVKSNDDRFVCSHYMTIWNSSIWWRK